MNRNDDVLFPLLIIVAMILFGVSQSWGIGFATFLDALAGTLAIVVPGGLMMAFAIYFAGEWRAQVILGALGIVLVLLGPIWLPAIQEAHGVVPPSDFFKKMNIHGDSFWESWLGTHLMQIIGTLMIAIGVVSGFMKPRY